MSGNDATRIVWAPQKGPQKALIDCPIPEVFYGGARGGGKTDSVLGKYGIKAERYGAGFNAIFFRRELPMLDDAIERSHEIYTPLGAKWQDQKKTWRWPNGGRVRFRPLERTADAEKYQGQNISDACVEEAGQYPDPAPIDRLNGVLRSAKGVPTQLLMTGNPGGPGQQWIKTRYIDPCPSGMRVQTRKLPNGKEHKFVFIPSRLQNNQMLMQADPEYINRLYLVGSEELVRAWLEGDWNAIEGAYFDCWSQKIVIKPVGLPDHWLRFRSFDWGSAAPFSVGWWAVASEDFVHPGGIIQKDAMVRYREWYGKSDVNKGLKLTAEEVAEGIRDRTQESIAYSVADPAIFAEDGGPSIAERMGAAEIYWTPADNKRVARNGAIGGWDQLRQRMKGMDDRPMIYTFDTCVDSIRTIPMLQHDPVKPEDLDTSAEDHAADEWRYAAMSRPWTAPPITPPKRRDSWDAVFNDSFEESWRTA